MSTYRHTLTGRLFTVTGPGMLGASSASGEWDHGSGGTIFPRERLTDGRPVWTLVQCSWCDAPATRNLTSSEGDQCCADHHAQWFARHRADVTVTTATCPDCGQPYVVHADGGSDASLVFVCEGCTPSEWSEIRGSDVYVEHNETWSVDRSGRLLIVRRVA